MRERKSKADLNEGQEITLVRGWGHNPVSEHGGGMRNRVSKDESRGHTQVSGDGGLVCDVLLCSTVVSCKYGPSFATLASVQSAGGTYMRDGTFSFVIMPSLDQEMLSSSVDAGFFLHCHSTMETLNLTV